MWIRQIFHKSLTLLVGIRPFERPSSTLRLCSDQELFDSRADMADIRTMDLPPSLQHELDGLILMANDYRITKSIWSQYFAVADTDIG